MTTGVTTYLGLGALRLRAPPRPVTSKPVEQVVAADLDRDGRLISSTASIRSRRWAIQLGNGDGTFRAAPTVATAFFVDQLALGDVDGDGDVDLVVASFDDARTAHAAAATAPSRRRSCDRSPAP